MTRSGNYYHWQMAAWTWIAIARQARNRGAVAAYETAITHLRDARNEMRLSR